MKTNQFLIAVLVPLTLQSYSIDFVKTDVDIHDIFRELNFSASDTLQNENKEEEKTCLNMKSTEKEWETIYFGLKTPINDCWFFNPDTGYVFSGEVILHLSWFETYNTTDGGESWDTLKEFLPAQKCFFLNHEFKNIQIRA